MTRLAALLVSLTLACASLPSAHAQEPVYDVFLEIDVKAFAKLPNHKAMAVGESNYSWQSWDYSSAEEAKRNTLAQCKDFVAKSLKRKKVKDCVLVQVDNEFVWPGVKPRLIGQEDLPLPDKPLEQGLVYQPRGEPKAVILALHGCDNPGNAPPDWTMSWYRYFLARNYIIYEPNSFVDGIVEVCNVAVANKDTNNTLRIRISQVVRTMKILRERHPGLKIHIWGHSQGGRISQLFNYGADSIIISGDACDIDQIKVETPILYVAGENDPYIVFDDKPQKLTQKLITQNCAGYQRNKRRNIVVVKGEGHFTAIWHQNLIDAVSTFLGEPSRKITAKRWKGELPSGLDNVVKDYESGTGNKALAVRGGAESYGIAAWGWDTKVDAEQFALMECERGDGLTALATDTSKECFLVKSQ
jgi:hypothetical protein